MVKIEEKQIAPPIRQNLQGRVDKAFIASLLRTLAYPRAHTVNVVLGNAGLKSLRVRKSRCGIEINNAHKNTAFRVFCYHKPRHIKDHLEV